MQVQPNNWQKVNYYCLWKWKYTYDKGIVIKRAKTINHPFLVRGLLFCFWKTHSGSRINLMGFLNGCSGPFPADASSPFRANEGPSAYRPWALAELTELVPCWHGMAGRHPQETTEGPNHSLFGLIQDRGPLWTTVTLTGPLVVFCGLRWSCVNKWPSPSWVD